MSFCSHAVKSRFFAEQCTAWKKSRELKLGAHRLTRVTD